jgi:hypothetical protein
MKSVKLPHLFLVGIPLVFIGAICALLAIAGCAATNGGRIQARINEKPEVFAKLTKQQKKDIKWGYVRRGYTPEMVYFALGKPDQILTSADRDAYVWVFIDRSAINEDVALASANGGPIAKVWGTHDKNVRLPPA